MTTMTLHEQATATFLALLSKLGITISDADLSGEQSENLVWLHSYPQACEAIGITNQECSDPYSYENGNGEQYEEEGRLFTLVMFAINEPNTLEKPQFFWIEFIFLTNNTVLLQVGAATPDSQYCDELLKNISGYERGCVFQTVAAATRVIKSLHQQLKADKNCFLKEL